MPTATTKPSSEGGAAEEVVRLRTPLTEEALLPLRAGQRVNLTGVLYVARDAAHKRMVEALDRGEALPFDVRGQVIYYMGPTPAKPGQVIGAAGPTTSSRMDSYAPRLFEQGLKGTIGKGGRAAAVVEAMVRHRAVYFAAVGGTGALLAKRIRRAETIAYADLGPEALLRLEVEDFPLILANDLHGGDIFRDGPRAYAR